MSTNGPESLLDVDELTQLVYRAMETGQLDAALSFAKQGLVKEPDHGNCAICWAWSMATWADRPGHHRNGPRRGAPAAVPAASHPSGLLLTAAGQAEDAINTLIPCCRPTPANPSGCSTAAWWRWPGTTWRGAWRNWNGFGNLRDEAVNVLLQRVVKGRGRR